MSFRNSTRIALGGFLGTSLRFFIDLHLDSIKYLFPNDFANSTIRYLTISLIPHLAVFIINMLAVFLAAYLLLVLKVDEKKRQLISIGFLGSLSTLAAITPSLYSGFVQIKHILLNQMSFDYLSSIIAQVVYPISFLFLNCIVGF